MPRSAPLPPKTTESDRPEVPSAPRRRHLRQVTSTDVYKQPLSLQEEILLLRRRLGKIRRGAKTELHSATLPDSRPALLQSFLAIVVAPVAIIWLYLAAFATPQYYSEAGFTARTLTPTPAEDVLAGVAGIAAQRPASENDILYAYLQSQELIANLRQQIDFAAHFSTGWARDPVFLLSADASLEDMHRYWRRMSDLSYDPGTGLIELRLRGRDPAWAQAALSLVLEAGRAKINEINASAFADSVRFAQETLLSAQSEWQEARVRMQQFRSQSGMVDPATEIASRMGVLTSLQHQLAATMIELDQLRQTVAPGDPRLIARADQVQVIQARIDQERRSLSGRRPEDSVNFPAWVSQFEALAADLDFAQNQYQMALAGLASSKSEAARHAGYLAVYVQPTLAQTAGFPDIATSLLVAVFFSGLIWAVFALVYLTARDRP